MRLAAVLALLAASTAHALSDPLAEARAAFAAKDYARAEQLALSVRAPGATEAAIYLVGLARFRAGRPAAALEALDRAPGGAESRGTWHYNRAACLQELGRLAEAEREFVAAADDAKLAAVALVGAGWAALEGGDVQRARVLTVRARTVASGAALALVADLEAEVGLAPPPPRTTAIPAAPAPAAAAPERPPLALREAALRVSGGWDGDALQSGLGVAERPGTASSGQASGFAETSAGIAARLRGGEALEGELAYGVTELAYQAPAARDWSIQQHHLAAALLLWPGAPLRADLKAEGQLAFAGWSNLRPMLAGAGLRLTLARDHGERLTSRIEAAAARLTGRGAEFAALGGHRLQAAFAEELRLSRLTLRAGYRLHLERIGFVYSEWTSLSFGPSCPMGGCPVTNRQSDPLGYTSHTGWAEALFRPLPWLELRAEGGAEWREHVRYRELTVEQNGLATTTPLGLRQDLRVFGGESATFHLSSHVSLFAAHALLWNRTFVRAASGMLVRRAPPAPDPAPSPSAWAKHVFSVGTEVAW